MKASKAQLIGWLLSLVVLFEASSSVGQQTDAVAEALGLTRENKALPLWEKPPAPAVEQLAAQVRSSHEGVMLVGHPDRGYGTAFVISREHRLLATNAHVADILHHAGSMLAIRNGTSDVYEIERAWYHPGTLRKKGETLSVRSQAPGDGSIDPFSPDVAVLRLKPGSSIPVELPFATDDEVRDLFARPVGMLGFPGYDTVAWPQLGQKAQATFHQGVVSRLTDFSLNADARPEELQMVQHTMSSWGGFSGSPLFLPNGHVIALHNMSRNVSRGGEVRSIPHGVRIDYLWELIAYHQLENDVPLPVDSQSLNVTRYDQPRPQDEKLRIAQQHCANAVILVMTGKNQDAVREAQQAIDLVPTFSTGFAARGSAYSNFGVLNEPRFATREHSKSTDK